MTTFQSRFGAQEWLQPYTDKTIEQLAKDGVRRIAVVTPGFSADCLETLEEIALRGRDIFLAHMGETLVYLPCLNAGDEAISFYGRLLRDELGGWI